MRAAESCWRIDGDDAQLTCGALRGRVEFDGRLTRFRIERWNDRPIENCLVLATGGPVHQARTQISERYVRGSDLVEVYEKKPPQHLAPQFYWRARFHERLPAVQLEAILSVQTDLLDSDPESNVASRVTASDIF